MHFFKIYAFAHISLIDLFLSLHADLFNAFLVNESIVLVDSQHVLAWVEHNHLSLICRCEIWNDLTVSCHIHGFSQIIELLLRVAPDFDFSISALSQDVKDTRVLLVLCKRDYSAINFEIVAKLLQKDPARAIFNLKVKPLKATVLEEYTNACTIGIESSLSSEDLHHLLLEQVSITLVSCNHCLVVS